MIDDFVPIVHRLDGRTVKVYGIADVHIGAKECDLDGFRAFISERVAPDPDAYICLVGDILNNGIRDSVTNVYEETMPPSAQVETAVEILTPVKDKILGAVGGNHEYRSKRAVDWDPMFQAMTLLGIPELYRQNMAFIRVVLERGVTRDHYALLLAHGSSDAKRQRFDAVIEGVDAVITGHVHRGAVQRPCRIVFTNRNTITVRPHISLVCESWLKYGGYASRGLLLPHETANPQHLVLGFSGSNRVPGRLSVVW